MFEIDLKQGARPPAGPEGTVAEVQALARILAPVAAAIVVLAVAVWAIDASLERSIAKHEARVSELESALSASRQKLAEVSGKRRVLYDIAQQEIYWSDELRLVSEKLPDKAWLTQIRVMSSAPSKGPSGEAVAPAPQGLMIEGGVLSNSSEGNLDVIGKFIQDLQADKRFQDSFSSINLESVQRTSDPYALGFRLKLGFKS